MSRRFGMRPWRRRTVYLAVAIGVGVGGFLIVRKVWKKRVAAVTASTTSGTPATRESAVVVSNDGDDAVVPTEGGEDAAVLQVADGEGGGAVRAIVNVEGAAILHVIKTSPLSRSGRTAASSPLMFANPALHRSMIEELCFDPLSRSGSTAASSPLISANTALHRSMLEGLCFNTLSDTEGATVPATSVSFRAVMSDSEDAAVLARFMTNESEALIADAITSTEETTGTAATDVNEVEGSFKKEGTAVSVDASTTFAGTETLTTADTEVQTSFIETTGGSDEGAAGYKNEDDDTYAAVGKPCECDGLIDATIDDACLIDEEILVVGKTSGEKPPVAGICCSKRRLSRHMENRSYDAQTENSDVVKGGTHVDHTS